MLRTRLLTSLAFNVVVAVWVFQDARARGARKPLFAAVLALVWGPLGMGLWLSDRPLRQREERYGSAGRNIALGFLTGWVALLPAMLMLAMQVVEHRAAVPGSLGRQIGILPATVVVTSMFWVGPAVLAVLLGRFGRPCSVEHGTASTQTPSLPSWAAAGLAGAAALVVALSMR
jgi:hypothetical protein